MRTNIYIQNIQLRKNMKFRISGINAEWKSGEDIALENLYNDSEPIANYKFEKLEEI